MPTMDNARARHDYAGKVPEAVAKALMIDWNREGVDADMWEQLELMITNALYVAVEEGLNHA